MHPSSIDILGPDGAAHAARLVTPLDGVARATALLAHDLGRARPDDVALVLARALAMRGIATLVVDGPPVGADTDGATAAALLAGAAFLTRELGAPPTLGVAHGRAADAMLHTLAGWGATRALALVNPRVEKSHARELAAALPPGALLVLRSTHDAAGGPVVGGSVVLIDGADYALGAARDAAWAAELVATWATRRVVPEPGHVPPEAVPSAEGARVVARTRAGGFRTEVMAGGHALIVDEPLRVGGTDEGPTPYDLLTAALGACTAMTLHQYARRKGWPLEEAVVWLRHGRVHEADDEAACANRPARLDAIERLVELAGPLDAAQRARLLEIADRCPVHRTLDAGVRIASRGGVEAT